MFIEGPPRRCAPVLVGNLATMDIYEALTIDLRLGDRINWSDRKPSSARVYLAVNKSSRIGDGTMLPKR
jgi:hypothetical protein